MHALRGPQTEPGVKPKASFLDHAIRGPLGRRQSKPWLVLRYCVHANRGFSQVAFRRTNSVSSGILVAKSQRHEVH